MAVFICTNCGTEHRIFGEGSLDLDVPKLGSLPLSMEMREARDGYEEVAKSLANLLD